MESSYYPKVEGWMRRHFRCFRTACNVGLNYSRVDALGVRDVGGILSGEIEVVCIEVKRGAEAFATASGQASGYSIYANRAYLADVRDEGFKPVELEIASHLGIGLIRLSANGCKEELSSPNHNPVPRMPLELVAKLGLANCQFRETFFECGRDGSSRLANVTTSGVALAAAKGKGLAFWLSALSARKRKLGIGRGYPGFTVERRSVCPECIQHFFPPA
jgi:hypothetical protein